MNSISSDILNLTSEAAVLVRCGKVNFANDAARSILGADAEGRNINSFFSPDVTGAQCSSFIADTPVAGRHCIVRVSHVDGDLIIFFSPSITPSAVLNEPFLCSMRNSLMASEISTNLLRDEAEIIKDAKLLKSISVLTRSHCQMIRLINNASFVLNSDEQVSPAAIRSFNISSLYSDILSGLCNLSNCPEISMNLGKDIILNADPNLISNLLLNLISNCIIHAHGCSKISVVLSDTPESVILSVSDDGKGIDPEKLHTVFERYRYGFSLSSMGKGVGLGLTVVRRIAQMHGGTLLLESRPDWGTTVRVSFSKFTSPVLSLHCSSAPVHISANDTLIGLADCLPSEYYSEKFLD